MKIKENVLTILDKSRHGFRQLHFSDLYDSVEECIEELKQISDATIRTELQGIEYIESLKKQLLSGKELTSKQIIQLKRLAPEIARGYYIDGARKKDNHKR